MLLNYRELLKANATEIETVYNTLLRQVPVGEQGISFALALLEAFEENMGWLQGRQLLPVACYAFLRLLADHVTVRRFCCSCGLLDEVCYCPGVTN